MKRSHSNTKLAMPSSSAVDTPSFSFTKKVFTQTALNWERPREYTERSPFDSGDLVLPTQQDVHWSIILPDSSIRLLWNTLNMLSLVYVCVCSPYLICFESNPLESYLSLNNITVEQVEAQNEWIARTDRSFDLFYAMDIVLNFRFAYIEKKSGTMITDTVKIGKHYIRQGFLFDAMITIPWDGIVKASNSSYLALFHVLRIFRLSKLLRFLKFGQVMEFLEDRLQVSRNTVVSIELLSVIALVAHFTACGFYLVAHLENIASQTSWVAQLGFLENSPWNLYIISLYWALTLMTTIGFGDVYPVTIAERAFAIIAMCISAATYAYVIASMSSIVMLVNVNQSRYYDRLNEVNAYMEARRLPPLLQLRTRKYYRYFLQHKTVYNEARILEDLPTSLKLEVTEHYAKITIRDVAFFQDLPRGFAREVAMYLKPSFFTPNSSVIAMGDTAHEMYIISKGILHVSLMHKETMQEFGIAYLYDGDHFGEMALLLPDYHEVRTANVRSEIYCELHGLKYDHLKMVLARYPAVLEKLMKIALARQVLLVNLQNNKVTSMITAMPKSRSESHFYRNATQSKSRLLLRGPQRMLSRRKTFAD